MKIALGNDHAGFPLKAFVQSVLEDLGHEVIDCGAPGEPRSTFRTSPGPPATWWRLRPGASGSCWSAAPGSVP